MNTKLTLKLDKDIIDGAKAYAKEKHTSLSLLVANYFKSLAEGKDKPDIELSPIVQELSGIIVLPEDFNLKEDYTSYLIEKYSYDARVKSKSIPAAGITTHLL